jgi:6-pyruvoyl-tetrahydropterin synthase related domain
LVKRETPIKKLGLGRRTLPIIFVLAAAAVVTQGVWSTHLNFGHSSHIDLIRQVEVNEAVRDGYVYPRWIADFYYGRGSPIFNFYAPLMYIVGEFFCFFGLAPLYAVKIMYILTVMLAGIAMYFLAREIWDLPAALSSAVMYILAPYLLVDLYIRGALAELAGFALLPLAMYFLLRESKTNTTHDAARAAAAIALLCLSHNISALIGAPILIIWAILIRDKATWKKLFVAIGLGLLMSSFFWAPALYETKYLNAAANLTQGDYHYSRHFVSIKALFDTAWGFGSPMNPDGDGMSRQVGILHWILFLPALAWFVLSGRRWDLRKRGATAFLLIGAIGLFFTLNISKPLWDILPLLPFVQFPFRFLMIATLGFTGAAGALIVLVGGRFGPRWGWGAAMAVILSAVVIYGPYAQARYLLHDKSNPNRILKVSRKRAKEALATGMAIEAHELLTPKVLREFRESKTTAMDDYLPKWVMEKPAFYYAEKFEVIAGDAKIRLKQDKDFMSRVHIEAQEPSQILAHTFYFPGWTAWKKGTALPLEARENTGEIVITVPPGDYEMILSFEDTPIRIFAKFISISATVGIIAWMGVAQYRRIRTGESSSRTSRRNRRRRRRLPRHRHPLLRLYRRRHPAPQPDDPDP